MKYHHGLQCRLQPVRGKGLSRLRFSDRASTSLTRERTPGIKGGTMSRNLPELPNLEHLRKQAKALLRELRQQSPEATLAEAQHTIARLYGFASWPKLKAHVESLPRPANHSGAKDAEAGRSGAGGGGGATSGRVASHDDSGGRGGLFPRFTDKARRTMFFARYFAERESKPIGAEHLLLGLNQADEELMNRLLPGRFQAAPAPGTEERARLKASLLERIPKLHRGGGRTMTVEGPSTTVDPLSAECRRILEHAAKEADRLGHQKISTGHFLLGFLCDEVSNATPILMDILTEKGIRLDTFREQIIRSLSEERS
jgi:hypothetical protein